MSATDEDVKEFTLTEEQEMLRQVARDYLDERCSLEQVRAWDEAGEFPMEVYRELAEMGWLGISFSEEYGGADGDEIQEAIILSELGRVMGPLASTFLISALTCGKTVRDLGTPEQLAAWIPGICDASMIFAFALTEPGAGSDAAALTTRAVKTDQGWSITGQKIYCTGAMLASHLLVMARTDDRPASERGDVSMFVVETGTAGLSMTNIPKLGLHTTPSCSVFLDDVVVPDNHLLGIAGGAWNHVFSSLNRERLAIAAMCTGMATAALEVASEYASERRQFGRRIDGFEAVEQHLTQIFIEVQAARALMQHAAYLESVGTPSTRSASTGKLRAAEAAVNSARIGMQVMGGAGYANEYPMQRFLRDALIHPIAGGSNEIQRNIISDDLLRNGI